MVSKNPVVQILGYVEDYRSRQFAVQVGAMAKDNKLRVEKFNGQNYQLWKMHIEDYLYQKDLYLSLGGKVMKHKSMTYPAWEFLNTKAFGSIRLCLAASVTFNISKEKTTIGLMTSLDKLY